MISGGVSFVHLSDIHFTRQSGGSFDLDDEIRHELTRDASELFSRLGPPAGLFVTGDIAFSGARQEYEAAAAWLDGFAASVRCPGESVWIVPGNHDVDRSKISASPTIRLLQGNLRRATVNGIDEAIREVCSDPTLAAALLEPLAEYNIFAAKYRCDVTGDRHYWQRDLVVGTGMTLRLRGLTSVLVSNADDVRGNLVLGSLQPAVLRQEGIEYLTLCHHPPDWFLDHDVFTDHIEAKVRVQLFGHKHAQRLRRINNGIRLVAGAMHPDRREPDWEPTYNVIQFFVRADGALVLRVYARRWHRQDRRFVRDADPNTGGEFSEHVFPDHMWRIPAMTGPPADKLPSAGEQTGSPGEATRVTPGADPDPMLSPAQDPERRLTYRFLSLPFRHQMAITQKLDLLDDNDRALANSALFVLIFARAAEKQRLARLWDETEAYYPDPSESNPFAGR